MSNYWIWAWLFSLASFSLAFYYFRPRYGTTKAFVFSAPFFLAPVADLLSGTNSLIYLLDLAVPLGLYQFLKCYPRLSTRLKAAIACYLAVGCLALFRSVILTQVTREDRLYAVIDLYRMLGMAFVLVMAACAVPRRGYLQRKSNLNVMILVGFAVSLIGTAIVLQAFKVIDSNIFYQLKGDDADYDPSAQGYAVLGLFRGSIGMIAYLGIAGALALPQGRTFWKLLLLGSGFGAILGCGSKTSLLAGLLIMFVAYSTDLADFNLVKIFRNVLVFVFIGVASFFIFEKIPMAVQGMYSELIEGHAKTLDIRESRYQDAVQSLGERPLILFMLDSDPGTQEQTIGYYHDEPLGILMCSGILGLFLYLAFLWNLGMALFKSRNRSRIAYFGWLAFAGGFIHGITVDHMVPGLYFYNTGGLYMLIYGFALSANGGIVE